MNITFFPKNFAAIHVEIKIDKSKYVLSSDKAFYINNTLVTSKVTIYIDANKNERSIQQQDLSNLDCTEIKEIGFKVLKLDKVLGLWKIQAAHLTQKVKKVSAKILNKLLI